MFQLILPYKKNTVECTVIDTQSWLIMHQLFTPSTRERFALKSIYTYAAPYFSNQLIATETLKQVLEHRWLLLSVLEDTIGTEQIFASINCFNAISWHKDRKSTRLNSSHRR